MRATLPNEFRVAVLVDCGNLFHETLEHTLRVVAQVVRVVLHRDHGNHKALSGRWKEVLLPRAFTLCRQYQSAARKATAGIALVLDALKAHFACRANTFCLVTSDSDIACRCHKLRERGTTVGSVEEPKKTSALRNAGEQFFERIRTEPAAEPSGDMGEETATKTGTCVKSEPAKQEQPKSPVKRSTRIVVRVVSLLANDASEGKVPLGSSGQFLMRTDLVFWPKAHVDSGLETYDLLTSTQGPGGLWSMPLTTSEGAVCEPLIEAAPAWSLGLAVKRRLYRSRFILSSALGY